MDVMEAIRNRHSYRGRYRDVPVPREDLVRIMQAGLDAPSGCNKQTTSLIAVDDLFGTDVASFPRDAAFFVIEQQRLDAVKGIRKFRFGGFTRFKFVP